MIKTVLLGTYHYVLSYGLSQATVISLRCRLKMTRRTRPPDPPWGLWVALVLIGIVIGSTFAEVPGKNKLQLLKYIFGNLRKVHAVLLFYVRLRELVNNFAFKMSVAPRLYLR